jgi:hypothetical protein
LRLLSPNTNLKRRNLRRLLDILSHLLAFLVGTNES